MTLAEWLAFGIEAGFCTSVYCDTHDGWAPEDDARQAALMDGRFYPDCCTFVVRIKETGE